MCYAPNTVKFSKIDKPGYLEIRIPKTIEFSHGTYHLGNISELYRNNKWGRSWGNGEESDCDGIAVSFTDILVTGFFIKMPLGIFDVDKRIRVGFIGEKEYKEFEPKFYPFLGTETTREPLEPIYIDVEKFKKTEEDLVDIYSSSYN